jgi:hypothetical protein
MKTTTKLPVMITACIFCMSFMLLSGGANSQTMSVNPFQINLNAQGSSENLQCAYPGVLASSNVTDVDIQIYFAGNFVANAYNVDYCATDNMIFVQFDWATLIGSPVLLALANTGQVEVTISGTFSVTTSTGVVITYNADRWGYAEVIKPGKKK